VPVSGQFVYGQPASSFLSITTWCSLATDTTTHVQIPRNGMGYVLE